MIPRIKKRQHPNCGKNAFTLTDLLVLIVVLGVLVMIVIPALASTQYKGGRLECANNLRQIGMESMVYASESGGWLPICTLGSANGSGATRNHLGGEHYTTYVYLGTPGVPITTNEPPNPGNGYQNLGYLFADGMAGNGSMFYCPAERGADGLSAINYSPLLTTDSGGAVKSSYFFNPRLINAINNNLRRYQTVSQLEPHRLLALDNIKNPSTGGNTVPGVPPNSIQHARDHGWNVLFTDDSVQFCRLTPANNVFYRAITTELISGESTTSLAGYDQVFNALEQDH